MSPVGALSDAAATLAIALGAALIVWNDEIARAITDRLGWFGLAARRAARASCLVAGVMIAALGAVCALSATVVHRPVSRSGSNPTALTATATPRRPQAVVPVTSAR